MSTAPLRRSMKVRDAFPSFAQFPLPVVWTGGCSVRAAPGRAVHSRICAIPAVPLSPPEGCSVGCSAGANRAFPHLRNSRCPRSHRRGCGVARWAGSNGASPHLRNSRCRLSGPGDAVCALRQAEQCIRAFAQFPLSHCRRRRDAVWGAPQGPTVHSRICAIPAVRGRIGGVRCGALGRVQRCIPAFAQFPLVVASSAEFAPRAGRDFSHLSADRMPWSQGRICLELQSLTNFRTFRNFRTGCTLLAARPSRRRRRAGHALLPAAPQQGRRPRATHATRTCSTPA